VIAEAIRKRERDSWLIEKIRLRRDMKLLLSRLGQVVALLVILPSIAAISAYTYHVATLGDYARYKRDPNRFYDEHSAAELSFDCERIRDDFVKMTHDAIVSDAHKFGLSREVIDMLVRYRALGAWRKGGTLHLADSSIVGSEAFAAWKIMWST